MSALPAQYFRAGAGAWIENADGRVLVGERTRVRGSWQLPQGGLKKGEKPEKAVLREVEEETGLAPRHVRIVKRRADPVVYELPGAYVSEKTGRGQVLYWFALEMRAGDGAIRLPKNGEFRAWKWASVAWLLRHGADFKRPMYRVVAAAFARRPRKPRRRRGVRKVTRRVR